MAGFVDSITTLPIPRKLAARIPSRPFVHGIRASRRLWSWHEFFARIHLFFVHSPKPTPLRPSLCLSSTKEQRSGGWFQRKQRDLNEGCHYRRQLAARNDNATLVKKRQERERRFIQDIKLSYSRPSRINDLAVLSIRLYFRIVYPELRSHGFGFFFDPHTGIDDKLGSVWSRRIAAKKGHKWWNSWRDCAKSTVLG